MKRNKIAMLLAMALTVTQSVAVPVAAEELTADAGQEVEMAQDDADAEVAVEADEDASEEAEAEIQDDAEELQDEDFAAEEDLSDGTAQEIFSDDAGEAGEKRYEFGRNYDDSSSNTGYMLPNSTMNISTWLDCVDGDDWNEISEYSLKLLPMEEGYAGMATVSLNGTEIVVKSGSKAGDITIPVEVLVDGKTVATEWIWVGISEYVIEPEDYSDEDGNTINPKVGEQLDIKKDMDPQIVRYENGKSVPVTGDNYRIIINSWRDDETGETEYDYDTDGWKWIDVEGQELPILERTASFSTIFTLTAQVKDENGQWQKLVDHQYYFAGVFDGGETNEARLKPEVLEDTEGNRLNPKVGESLDIGRLGIGMWCYEPELGGWAPIGDPNLRVIVKEYDEDGWNLQRNLQPSGYDLPIMTRTTYNATWFTVVAEEFHEEVGAWLEIDRVKYEFDETKEHVHVEVRDAAVAPTVFADGKTEGSHCSVCGTVLEKQNTIAKVPGTIYLTASSLKMKTGQSTTAFKATGFSEGDYVTAVTSNKPGTVKVTNVNKNGTFKLTAGKKKGSAVVTVTLASKKTASFKVTVQKAAVKTTKITTTTKSLTLAKGATYKKLASSIAVTPVTSKEKVTYSSSNKKVATVSSKGVIKAKKAGTAKITVKSGKKKVVVTVKVTGVKTTKLSGVPAAKNVSKGKSFKIKAIATPKNTDEKITFKSSNKKVATVTSKGVVKGLKKGAATITVQSGSKKMTCKVTVK
ncbi:Ig-like domain-containing protein [Blautia obeum]|uniref:Ig-like domain-containing protein n=1 Tax=Blautia obeum TaxID=40520 RepID=UPI0018AAA5A2|nr:Ig-like domain-containing protein [Blautia obeum]